MLACLTKLSVSYESSCVVKVQAVEGVLVLEQPLKQALMGLPPAWQDPL